MKPAEYAKAIAGALIPALTAFYQANQDSHVTVNEWVVVAIAAVTGFGGVWLVPNAKTATGPTSPATLPDGDALILDEP